MPSESDDNGNSNTQEGSQAQSVANVPSPSVVSPNTSGNNESNSGAPSHSLSGTDASATMGQNQSAPSPRPQPDQPNNDNVPNGVIFNGNLDFVDEVLQEPVVDVEAEEFRRRFFEAIARRNAYPQDSPPEYEEFDEDDNVDLIEEIIDDEDELWTLSSGSPQREDRDFDSDENALLDREEISSVPVFDLQLPSRHSYLGDGMEALAGRTILEGGAMAEIPLVLLEFHLVPGQTLPLTVFHSVTQSALLRCVPHNRHFGIVHSGLNDVNIRSPLPRRALGTTAEIYEFQEDRLNDDPTNRSHHPSVNIKAKGRHRFNVLSTYRQSDGHLMAKVKIRPEITLTKPWKNIMSSGHRHMFPYSSTFSDNKKICNNVLKDKSNQASSSSCGIKDSLKDVSTFSRTINRKKTKYYSAMTPWPYFVYDQFDEEILVEKIHRKLHEDLSSLAALSSIPRDAMDLSFWLAQNLTMSDSLRLQMLKMDTPVERLRFASRLLDKVSRVIECNQCHGVIASHNDIFPMSIEGPQGTYVNPHGFVHELITVTRIKNTVYRGLPSTEASWFPGYSWRIIECRVCSSHVGWKFEAVERLKPAKFWGLAKRSISFKYDFNIQNDCPDLDAPLPTCATRSRTDSERSGATERDERQSESSSVVNGML